MSEVSAAGRETEVPRSESDEAKLAPAARAVARTRIGAAGMLALATLVMVALFAEMLASDLPIACKVRGETWLFPNVTRPVELASMPYGRLAEEADWAVFPVVSHGPSLARDEEAPALAPPGAVAGHPLGTDREGRDVFALVVYGTRSYFVFALIAVAASIALGGALGGLAGFFGGATDALVTRAIETVSAFPPLILVIGVQAAVPHPSLTTLFLAIALTRWPEVTRLVRAEVMLVSTREYVRAARALGASPLRVLRKHVGPNVRAPLVVNAALGISAVVLLEASLDFLRVGAPPGSASWGQTMSEFRDAPAAWWLLAFPGALLFVTVVGNMIVGEVLRQRLDPRVR